MIINSHITPPSVKLSLNTKVFINTKRKNRKKFKSRSLIKSHNTIIQAISNEPQAFIHEEALTHDDILKLKPVPVQLSMVTLRSSVPSTWLIEFQRIVGVQNKIRNKSKLDLQTIFEDLESGKYNNTDLVSIGDGWLNAAIKRNLIQPFPNAINYRWYLNLPNKWRIIVQPMSNDKLSQKRGYNMDIWAVPYKWGCTLVAYLPDKLKKAGIPFPKDWNDLLHPSLNKKISLMNSPRQLIGICLKMNGLNYNASIKEIKNNMKAIKNTLNKLIIQALVISNTDHVKAMTLSDAWICVGSSQDILPLANRKSSIKFFIPKSGTSLWADLFVIPKRKVIDENTLGISPLVNTWLDYILSPSRSHNGKNLINGLPPSELEFDNSALIDNNENDAAFEIDAKNRFLPPSWVWQKCEFLLPLDADKRYLYQEILS